MRKFEEDTILYEVRPTRIQIDEIKCETQESLHKLLDKLKAVASKTQHELYYAGHLSDEIRQWMLAYGFIENPVEPLNCYLRYRWRD